MSQPTYNEHSDSDLYLFSYGNLLAKSVITYKKNLIDEVNNTLRQCGKQEISVSGRNFSEFVQQAKKVNIRIYRVIEL